MSRLTRRDFLAVAGLSAALGCATSTKSDELSAQAQNKIGGIKMRENLPFGMGVVSFALNGDFDNPDPETLVEKVNQLEIPGQKRYIELLAMPGTDPRNIETIAQVLDKSKYGRTICAFRPGEETPDMMSAKKDEVDQALAQVYNIMECAKATGATRVGGPWIRNHGNLAPGDGRHLEYALGGVANKAEKMGIYMCQEMLVAWETGGFNCVADTLPIIQKVGSDHVLIHYDTAHASRQELDIIPAATELYMSGKFGHAHISENGRGPIRAGPVSEKLVPYLHNLAALGYGKQGEVVIVEVFHPSMWGAVKRADPTGILKQSPEKQDAFALREAKLSLQNISLAYNTVAEYMAPK